MQFSPLAVVSSGFCESRARVYACRGRKYQFTDSLYAFLMGALSQKSKSVTEKGARPQPLYAASASSLPPISSSTPSAAGMTSSAPRWNG